MKTDLRGAVALVTGAAQGIGAAIAELLAANGAVVVVADVNAEGAAQQAARLGGRASALAMDVSDAETVERGVTATLKSFGRIDILVNNAGINTLAHRVPIDSFPIDEWRRIISVDLDGVFLLSRRVAQGMRAQQSGRIVNIASVVAIMPLRLQCAFAAAKAGVAHLTRAMALELAPAGIRVNAVAPGSVLTEATRRLFYGDDGLFHAQVGQLMRHIPLGRPGTPAEIAQGVLFLASPASAYVNGHVLTVDGGWTAGFML
jgi:NAD(P)-dependent dehydrogenase (short-subunit alcohol dehydrogenase family)